MELNASCLDVPCYLNAYGILSARSIIKRAAPVKVRAGYILGRTSMLEALARRLQTISAITITPFDEQLNVDFAELQRNLDYLTRHGMEVVVPCGNTGEFYSLTSEEQRQIVAFACESVRDRAIVVAGVGYSVDTAVEMARFAAEHGCEAVMVHHPVHPFVSGPGYFEYVSRIAAAVGIGVVPYIRSSAIPNQVILDLVRIENVVGVKYAVNDLQRFSWLVARSPRDTEVAWICGTAEGWAPFFFAAGATGFTSGLVNVAPDKSLEMLEALRRGDFPTARAVWAAIKPFEDLRARNGNEHNVSVVKEAMAQLGLGNRRVRPPISELPDEERLVVRRILRDWKGTSNQEISTPA